MQCNPTCGGFVCDRGALDKRLVMTHLKAPFEFRLIGMQEENKVIFFVELF
jgi:Zn-finger nucleic acid-binding protein